jgi:hypothetical protein
MHIPVQINVNTDHISITDLTHNVAEGINDWIINAVLHVPDGHVYEGLPWPVRNDRMSWYIGPVVVPDVFIQQLLGDMYQGVVTAMTLGNFKPGREIQQLLIQALGTK